MKVTQLTAIVGIDGKEYACEAMLTLGDRDMEISDLDTIMLMMRIIESASKLGVDLYKEQLYSFWSSYVGVKKHEEGTDVDLLVLAFISEFGVGNSFFSIGETVRVNKNEVWEFDPSAIEKEEQT